MNVALAGKYGVVSGQTAEASSMASGGDQGQNSKRNGAQMRLTGELMTTRNTDLVGTDLCMRGNVDSW